jgi:hypothetical protein
MKTLLERLTLLALWLNLFSWIALLIFFIGLSWPARAHEAPSGQSYSFSCCSDKDCAPLPEGAVQTVPGGYSVEGEFIANNDERLRPSTDGGYHICRYSPQRIGSKIRCLYTPPFGS